MLMFGQFPEYRKCYGRSNQGALASSFALPETCGDQILPAVAKYGMLSANLMFVRTSSKSTRVPVIIG